jgi:hypothetical protein
MQGVVGSSPIISTQFCLVAGVTPIGPGDLLVPPASANGRHPRNRHIPFGVDHCHHLAHSHHFDLLNHPAVYDAMEACLQTQPPGAQLGGRPSLTTAGDLTAAP